MKNAQTTTSAPLALNNGVIGRLVTVCDKCLQASCWQGIMMCDGARNAGTVDKSIGELKQLALEHPSYWEENVR